MMYTLQYKNVQNQDDTNNILMAYNMSLERRDVNQIFYRQLTMDYQYILR
jgi:hypothetical protein